VNSVAGLLCVLRGTLLFGTHLSRLAVKPLANGLGQGLVHGDNSTPGVCHDPGKQTQLHLA